MEFLREIETPHLLLKKLRRQDVDRLYALYSDKTVTANLRIPTYQSKAEATALIHFYEEEMKLKHAICYMVWNGAHAVGICSLDEIHWDFQRATVNYALISDTDTELYGQEILTALAMEAKRLHLVRVSAVVNPADATYRLNLETAGFQKEGTLRKYWRYHHQLLDEVLYSLIQEPTDTQ
ncbi:hypothetical protein IV38_GL002135 [Lactobacillus selangorensis]|uniref:N-acetyltransferase domain-containing protein n=1 Tax=Lactobacillus selangorensis TaxID=81857 RepID=A0A0R2G1R7_9LACO|nr:GNAT family protein [Lactobacillus selangorensis]KRN27481.1 hypothetical protein IV38_GL002135 [Lactobacillus selangorensis]KRN31322.1 hypothetical protein IV40_GL001315 [Lactobacillus selangorensis]